MREKIGSLIQFLAVIVAFAAIFFGVGAAYDTFFAAEDMDALAKNSLSVMYLIIAAAGFGIGIVGIFVGNLLKR